MKRLLVVVGCAMAIPAGIGAQAPAAVAAVRPVTDTTFGIVVTDPYRWMERDTAEFNTWLRAQGRYARARLDALPARSALIARMHELMLTQSEVSHVRRAGSRLFFLRTAPGSPVGALTVRDRDGQERVLLDPARARDRGAGHASIDAFEPSPDGELVAVNVDDGGGEITRIQVIDAATGRSRPDTIERIWGEFAVSWLPDASGFFYTQMADRSTRPKETDPMLGMQARYHRLGGTADADPVLLGPGVNTAITIDPREFPMVKVPAGSMWVTAVIGGASPERRHCVVRVRELAGRNTPWRCVADYADQVEDFAIRGDDLYLLSSKNAPNRRILRVSLDHPELTNATVVASESSERPLTGLAAASDALYVTALDRGSDVLLRVPYDGGAAQRLTTPAHARALAVSATPAANGAIVSAEDLMLPRAWYAFEPDHASFRDLSLRGSTTADVSHIIMESVDVPSFDGTLVPLHIARLDTLRLDGNHVALLTGYAAYGIVLPPIFLPQFIPILERGGVAAHCGARGGGEKGRAWSLAGKGENKLTGVRDFIACGEYLVAHGYTRASRLAASSGSMGGVLVGGAITERPDLFAAATIDVGVLDPVRILEGINGANQIGEIGDPRVETGFRSLLAMDPYQHIRDGVRYPAVLLNIGLNDGRVSAWHTGKFAARLQAASTSGRPVLIRIDEDAGHMAASSTRDQVAALEADRWAFLLWQLGGHR